MTDINDLDVLWLEASAKPYRLNELAERMRAMPGVMLTEAGAYDLLTNNEPPSVRYGRIKQRWTEMRG